MAPVLEWLGELGRSDRKACAKCWVAIERLAEFGHELRRPIADYLGDKLYELRIKKGHVNYRILYFFHGQSMAVLGHALTKEGVIPDADLVRGHESKGRFSQNPEAHIYHGEV